MPSTHSAATKPDSMTAAPNGGCAAIVLAGGRSSRFGSDKLAADIVGTALLDRAVEAVSKVATEVLVVGREHPSHRWLSEPEPFKGPLNALRFGFEAVPNELLLVIAGDHPLIQLGMLELLIGSSDRVDAVVPVDRAGYRQPLLALYRRSILPAIEECLSGGRPSMTSLLESIEHRRLEPEVWEAVDPDGLSFIDVDTLAQLRDAESILSAGGKQQP